MVESKEKAIPKKKGRPATGRDPTMSMRMPLQLRSRVERWAKSQDDKSTLSLSKAICRLVEAGLAAKLKR